ncbi:MAG: metal-dependent hydrolase [Xenococcus sp. (in: cyanobacteria)]
MMAITHAIIAAAGTSLILGTTDPLVFGCCIIGSQLPDLDTSKSVIGQICFPISSWIEDRYPHRTITHSVIATAVIFLVSLIVYFVLDIWFEPSLAAAIAVPIGHLLASASDAFTKQGVQLFWPDPGWCISVSNPRRRIKTGGTAEYSILVIVTALLILSIWINFNGGIFQNLGQKLGLSDAVLKVYNENAENHHVYADIEGFWESDRSSADGKYLILDNKGKEFVVTDGENVYKTGAQIIASKVKTIVGGKSENITKTLSFDDEKTGAKLNQIVENYPDSLIVVNGELEVELPGRIEIISRSNTMKTLSLSGRFLTFDNCLLENAIAVLDDQYAIGSIEVMVISHVPEV